MRAYVIAQMRGTDGEYPVPMAKALDEAPLFFTRRAAEHHAEVYEFKAPRWKVRAVTVRWARPSGKRSRT